MKKFLFVFSLLILAMGLTAETIVDYTQVSGNWNELGSPYIVTTNIEIPQNEILTIDAGVTIIMNDDVSITAYGVLNANGEVENLINFQGLNESTVWHGIEVNSEGSNFTHTNIIGAKRGLSFYKTNYANYCNLVGYGTDDFEQGLFVGKGNQSVLTNIDIHGYSTGVSIKADDDADDDHEPTTPTMDIIRIYYSLDSLKGDRSQPTRGIVIDTKSEPTLSNVEIVNYDEGVTIKADDDADDDHEPTTPTMDIIRIYYSLDSLKGDRSEPSKGVVVQGRSNAAFTDVEIVNYDEAVTIKADDDDDDDDRKPTTPTMDIIRIYYSLDSIKGDRSEPSKGIVVQGRSNAAFTDVEIENYDEAITIKTDDDDDDDRKPTTPTMDIIRIYYSLDSIKGDRTTSSKGIVVDGRTSPAFTDVEIGNYDEAITIKTDDDDDDDRKPTTPTMDIIRIYYSLDSIKGIADTRRASKGLSVEGRVNLALNNASIENFDIGLDFNSSGSHQLNDILLPNDSYSRDNYGMRAKGNNSFNINTINIQNYDNAISSICYAEETNSVISNAVISQTQRDRSNSKAISFQGSANLFVDNSSITNYDKSIYLKNNYPTPVTGKVEYTEIYQNGERRGSYSGIEFSGKVLAEINNNVIKSCDPAIKIQGNNSQSSIARNLIFITYEKSNSKAVDVKSINQNSMKHNTIVNYAQGLYAKHTPSSVINNIIWNNNPTNDIVSNYDYIEARYNNISLPNGRLFTGSRNLNKNPLFMGERLGFEPDPNKANFAEKWSGFQLELNSPCRDGGDPVETPDSDGTVPDLGAFEFVGNKDNTQVAVVSNLSLSNFPNPFNPSTNILFSIAEQGKVDLKVYNIKGQLVKTLLNEERAVGTHNIVWNGDDNRGKGVASGVYFVKIAQNKTQITHKILLAK